MRPSRLRMWPPLPPDVYLRRPARVPPFPLAAPGCLLLRKARQALFFGVQGLDLRPGDEVLMPAYHHGSEVEALLRTDLTCRFYDVGPSLRPDARALDELIGPRTRALYLIHYLGFAQNAPGWSRWCRERGLLLVEDVAQGWLASVQGRPLGSFGDMAVFSFSKAVGVPEGGALLSSRPANVAVDGRAGGTVKVARQLASRHEAWLTSRSSLAASLLAAPRTSGRRRPGPSASARSRPPRRGSSPTSCRGCWSPTRPSGGGATTGSSWASPPGRSRRRWRCCPTAPRRTSSRSGRPTSRG
jgi:hypothetical protein